MMRRLTFLAVSIWAGSLWSIGYLAAPVLFSTLPDKMLAGLLAGKMFTLVSYIGMGCATFLFICLFRNYGRHAVKHTSLWIILAMLLLAMIGEFGIQPMMSMLKVQALPSDVMHSPMAERFRLLHSLAEILYAMQSLLAVTLTLQPKLLDLR